MIHQVFLNSFYRIHENLNFIDSGKAKLYNPQKLNFSKKNKKGD